MRAYNLKYGFLTTYEHTLFLKQEKRGVTIVLYCSPPIGNDSLSSEDSVTLLQSYFCTYSTWRRALKTTGVL